MDWYGHRHHRWGCRPDEPEATLYGIVAPSMDDVLSLAGLKKHCRVEADNTDDDDALTAYRDAAIAYFDGPAGYLGRALTDQTWELRLAAFPASRSIRIPLPPLIEVVSVKYIDTLDAEQTLDPANYHVVGAGGPRGRIDLVGSQCWPQLARPWPEPVVVQFRAGYLDGGSSPAVANVPTPIIQAIKLLAEHWFENRSNVVVGQTAVELPWAVEALARPYRVMSA